MDNRAIADRLTGHAHSLERTSHSLFRIKAYRRAAETILGLGCPVEEIIEKQGRKGLEDLPGIGRRLSQAIINLIHTGEMPVGGHGGTS